MRFMTENESNFPMKIDIMPWEDWFDLAQEEIVARENVPDAIRERELPKIEEMANEIFSSNDFEFDWNYSFEVIEGGCVLDISVYDVTLVSSGIIEKVVAIPSRLEGDWLVRLGLYPQIRDAVKYGDSASAEVFVTKDRCCGWEVEDSAFLA